MKYMVTLKKYRVFYIEAESRADAYLIARKTPQDKNDHVEEVISIDELHQVSARK